MADWVPPETKVQPVPGFRKLCATWLNVDVPGEPDGFYNTYVGNIFQMAFSYLCARAGQGERMIRCSNIGTLYAMKRPPYIVTHTTGTATGSTATLVVCTEEQLCERAIVSARDYALGCYFHTAYTSPDDPIVINPGETRELDVEFTRFSYQSMGAGNARFRLVAMRMF